jgi:branched-chain amino acid aminotransferase
MSYPYTAINTDILAASEALVPVSDRSFRYGDGAFETIRIHQGIAPLWALHEARLSHALTALRIPAPGFSLHVIAQQLIAKNNTPESAVLRIHISRGSGSRGYLPSAEATPLVVMEILPAPAVPEQLNLWHSQWQRALPEQLPTSAKSAQGLGFTLARMEAEDHGYNEALLTNPHGEVCELTSAALIWQGADGTLYTPAASTGALESVMRSFIAQHVALIPVAAPLTTLQNAKAVVACNAAWLRCAPVTSLAPHGWQWAESAALAESINRHIRTSLPA